MHLIICTSTKSFSQPNDNCDNAINLRSDDTAYHFKNGNYFFASQEASIPKCPTEPANNRDIWYYFIASSNTQFIAVNACLTCFSVDLDYVMYTGTCNNLTIKNCGTQSTSFLGEYDRYDDLIIGTKYYLKVFNDNESDLGASNFTIGVRLLAPSDTTNPTSIKKTNEDTKQFKVYPNPSNGTFTIEVNTNEKNKIKILDLLGRVVFENEFDSKKFDINLSNHAKGLYSIIISNNKNKEVHKIIIQ